MLADASSTITNSPAAWPGSAGRISASANSAAASNCKMSSRLRRSRSSGRLALSSLSAMRQRYVLGTVRSS